MKKLTIISLLVVGAFLLAGAALPIPAANAGEILKYNCSNQIYKAFGKESVEAFTRETGIEVKIKTASSGSCVYAMMSGYCDVASTARALYRRQQDYGYLQFPFCLDPMAVIVNKDCGVESLTEEQVQDIFSGDITNWKEVGGPNLDITVIVPAKDTAANKNFRRQVMKYKDIKHGFMAYDSTMVIEAVKHFPCGSVSFISRGAAAHDKAIRTLKINGLSPSDKDYPYYQIFYYVTKGEPTDATKKFIDFASSKTGKKIIEKYGMVPIEK